MRPLAAALAVLVGAVLSSCAGSQAVEAPAASAAAALPSSTSPGSSPPGAPYATASSPSSSGSPTASDATFLPGPNAALPEGAPALAEAIEAATLAVRSSVSVWTREAGAQRWPPPRVLVLQTLYQQRIYRMLAHKPSLARRVLSSLPGSIGGEAEAIVRANADVFAHANPVPPSYTLRTRAPEPADVLLGYFREAERRFGVSWQLLAAVNYVETKFGRVVSNSTAGAQGPMQFLPSTWATYGLGGDIHDPHDAILGAANYLHANGAPGNIRTALYHYNPVASYVDAVATYASAIRRDSRIYYTLYCYQVYVLTTHGDRRITGPGL
jgi:soluble lytic murein transglycosylase-like protein